MLSELRLRNWKNFRQAELMLEPRTFIVGPNASGKSNLLDAIRFVRDLAAEAGGLQYAVSTRRSGFTSLRTLFQHGPRSHIEISCQWRLDPDVWTYRIELEKENKKSDRAVVLTEEVRRGDAQVLLRHAGQERTEERRQTYLEQSGRNERLEPLLFALRSIRYAHLVPQLLRTTKLHGDRELEEYGSRFLQRVSEAPARQRKSNFRRINRALKSVLPFFSKLDLERDDLGLPHLQLRLSHWRQEDAYQDESRLSDGTLRLIGLLWEIADGRGPLLLEEPELSLHGSAVRQLPALISAVAEERQVIVTTHAFSMFNGRGIDPREIVLVQPGHEEKAEASVVVSGAHDEDIIEAVRSELELGRYLEQKTAPEDVQTLASGAP